MRSEEEEDDDDERMVVTSEERQVLRGRGLGGGFGFFWSFFGGGMVCVYKVL